MHLSKVLGIFILFDSTVSYLSLRLKEHIIQIKVSPQTLIKGTGIGLNRDRLDTLQYIAEYNYGDNVLSFKLI